MSSKISIATISVILSLVLLVTLIPGCSGSKTPTWRINTGTITTTVKPLVPAGIADGYTAVIPSVLQTGTEQAISVTLFKGEQQVSGLVELILSKDNKEVFSTKDNINGSGQLTFTLPDITEGKYDVQIRGNAFSDETEVKVEKRYLVFVETDKPIYKPGQTIHMSLFTLNSDLIPISDNAVIEVLDAKGIKIYRTELQTDDYGMAAVDLPISTEPNLGVWKMTASSVNGKSELDVRVEEYVLPKYEVNVDLPKDWFLVNESITGSVSADYSFGKPVSGDLEIKAWRYVGEWEVYNTYTAKIDGQADFTLPAVGYVAGVPAAGGNGNVKLDVSVVEKATGYREQTSELLTVTESSLNIQIIPSGIVYKPGLPYSFLIVTQTPDNKLVDSKVTVDITYFDEDFSDMKHDAKTITTVKGKAMVELTPVAGSVALQINCSNETAQASRTIESGYSPSGNFIHLEQSREGTPAIGDEIRFRVYATEEAVNFYYEVISRGKVVFSDYTGSNEIAFQVTPQMAPSAKILVYQILPNSEVAADYLPFDVTAAYPQDVSVDFSRSQAEPGDDIDINIQTEGEAKVSLVAVDKSVFILAENRMNLQQVFDALEELYMTPQAELHEVSIYDGITTQGAKEIFDDAGVTVLSSNKIPEGEAYQQQVMREALGGGMFGDNAIQKAVPSTTIAAAPAPNVSSDSLAEVERVRQFFPETWLWQSVMTGSDGKAVVETTVPDSITTWMVRAVALSKEYGLGVAENQLVVFQPFFLSIDLPYSAVRGEEFPIEVAIYNYLDEKQSVTVEIQTDDWFNLLDDAVQTVDIAANDIGSVEFYISPKQLGTNSIKITARSKQAADAVIKTIIIEPEGVSRELVNNLVLAAGSQNTASTIPVVSIDGSGRAYFTVTSSYLTQTIDGLEGLIQMPFGCGEQNMIVMAPDIFITKYLEESGQLKPEIMAKAEKLMITGYQRELTYRHNDGSFSAFGESDESGSLWLTAFVLKSFAQAKDLIYIDDSILEEAASWIAAHQNEDGSFDVVGFIHHEDMMGGLTGKTALTAYVAVALMEAGDSDTAGRAVAYLEKQVDNISDSYTMALTAYALELAGSSRATDACTKLMGMAHEDGNGLYWGDAGGILETESSGQVIRETMPVQNRTAAIENTAYAALALTLQKDNLNAGKAAKWLVSQRNAYGGYGSTQDTVVALEALTRYASGSRADIDLTVEVKANGKTLKQLKLNTENYDVLQIVELPINQDISITVKGKGEAIGQLVRRYNVPEADTAREPILEIDVNYDATNVEVNDLVNVAVDLSFNPTEPMKAGMTVVDISVPTGFSPVADSIDKAVAGDKRIKRYDVSGRKVIFYIEDLSPGDKVSFNFDVQALYPVKAKGGVTKAYSYYQPEISAETLGLDMTVK